MRGNPAASSSGIGGKMGKVMGVAKVLLLTGRVGKGMRVVKVLLLLGKVAAVVTGVVMVVVVAPSLLAIPHMEQTSRFSASASFGMKGCAPAGKDIAKIKNNYAFDKQRFLCT